MKRLAAKGVKAWGRDIDVADPVALKGWIDGAAAQFEVAFGIVLLASPLASRISGTNLIIDGALTKAV